MTTIKLPVNYKDGLIEDADGVPIVRVVLGLAVKNKRRWRSVQEEEEIGNAVAAALNGAATPINIAGLVAALRNIRYNARSALGADQFWTAFELTTAVRIADAALVPFEKDGAL